MLRPQSMHGAGSLWAFTLALWLGSGTRYTLAPMSPIVQVAILAGVVLVLLVMVSVLIVVVRTACNQVNALVSLILMNEPVEFGGLGSRVRSLSISGLNVGFHRRLRLGEEPPLERCQLPLSRVRTVLGAGFLLSILIGGAAILTVEVVETAPQESVSLEQSALFILQTCVAVAFALTPLLLFLPTSSAMGARVAWALTGSDRYMKKWSDLRRARARWHRRPKSHEEVMRAVASSADAETVADACQVFFADEDTEILGRRFEVKPLEQFQVRERYVLPAIHLGRYEEAREASQWLLDELWRFGGEISSENYHRLSNSHAYVLALLGSDLDQAEGRAQQAYDSDPAPHVAGTLGAVLVQRDNPERGVALLGEALKVAEHPADRFETCRFLAEGFLRIGDLGEAKRYVDQAATEHPPFSDRLAGIKSALNL